MRFPLFIDLSGRAAVVVGGGAVGLRRAGALARFGARVTVISPAVRDVPEGVAYVRRGYQEVNHAVFLEAKRRGVAVNVCDCPEECDFFFPALCETGGVVAGVAGDGGDHQKTARAAAIIRRAWEEEL